MPPKRYTSARVASPASALLLAVMDADRQLHVRQHDGDVIAITVVCVSNKTTLYYSSLQHSKQ